MQYYKGILLNSKLFSFKFNEADGGGILCLNYIPVLEFPPPLPLTHLSHRAVEFSWFDSYEEQIT